MIIQSVGIRKKRLVAVKLDCDFETAECQKDAQGCLIIDRDTFELSGYKEGDEISDGELESLLHGAAVARAKSRAVWLLDTRDYCKRALFLKLKSLFGEDAAREALDELEEYGVVDDGRYAARYAESLINIKNMPSRMAVAKLVSKGVPRDIAKEAVDAQTPDADAQLDAIILKKYTAKLQSGDEDAEQKVIASLMRKGFGYGDIKTAVARYKENGDC